MEELKKLILCINRSWIQGKNYFCKRHWIDETNSFLQQKLDWQVYIHLIETRLGYQTETKLQELS